MREEGRYKSRKKQLKLLNDTKRVRWRTPKWRGKGWQKCPEMAEGDNGSR